MGRKFLDVPREVQEILASADPFYHGPHKGTDPPQDGDVHLLSWAKTANDLGYLEDEDTAQRVVEEMARERGETLDEPTARARARELLRRAREQLGRSH